MQSNQIFVLFLQKKSWVTTKLRDWSKPGPRPKTATACLCSDSAAILNAKFLPAAFTSVRRITVPYHNVDGSVLYSSVTIACMGLQSLWKIAVFPWPEVRRWPSDRRYGRLTLVTAGLLVAYSFFIVSHDGLRRDKLQK